jgi:beta-phosphoglucomutase-like phosphatase (HAD superfamily)
MSEEDNTTVEVAATKRANGFIVDLDYTLMNLTEALRNIYIQALENIDCGIPVEKFISKVYGKKIYTVAEDLIKETETEAADFVADIEKAMDGALADATPVKLVSAICKKILPTDMKCVFVTSRAVNVAQQVIEDLDMDESLILKADKQDYLGVYGSEVWAKAANMIHVSPRSCTVMTTPADSARAAMFLGMRTVALTNSMLEYQDYSGVDYFGALTDNNADEIAKSILSYAE